MLKALKEQNNKIEGRKLMSLEKTIEAIRKHSSLNKEIGAELSAVTNELHALVSFLYYETIDYMIEEGDVERIRERFIKATKALRGM